MATAAQFLNLPQQQKAWVAHFLGHDLRVSDQYYRIHTDAVYLAKVTKLLYMVHSGKLEHAYSKEVDAIQPTLVDGELDDSVSFTVFDASVLQMGMNRGVIFQIIEEIRML